MSWRKLTDYPENKVIGKEYGITYWKFENGKVWHQWKKLMKADFDSFEVYENNDFMARDKDNIYFAWTKLAKVDRNSFEEVGDSYWKDKNHAYFVNETSIKPLKGLDSKNFNFLGESFAFDNSFAYCDGRVMKSCTNPTTLKLIPNGGSYARDVNNIYFGGAVLKNADIKTWKLLENGFSRDEKSVFFLAKKLPKVDIETWEYIDHVYSKDKNHVYCMNHIKKDKSPKEWNLEKVNEYYEK